MKERSKGNWATESFKKLKNVEMGGGLVFSAVAAFVAPALVVPGLIFVGWEYGQKKIVEAWGNRKKKIPNSGVVYQAA